MDNDDEDADEGVGESAADVEPTDGELDAYEAALAEREVAQAAAAEQVGPDVGAMSDQEFQAFMVNPDRFGPDDEDEPYQSRDAELVAMSDAQFDQHVAGLMAAVDSDGVRR